MKRFITIFILSLLLFSFNPNAKAKTVQFGIFAGTSTPNDAIANVFNEESLTPQDGNPLPLLYGASELGWHIGINGKIKLSDNTYLDAGFAWHKFPEITNSFDDGTVKPLFKSETSVIPITLGIEYYLFKNFVSMYVKGDLAYNSISTDINTVFDIQSGLEEKLKDRSDNRFGCGIGAGVEVDAIILDLGLEVKYNWMNLIGKEADEEAKNYLGVSVYFYL